MTTKAFLDTSVLLRHLVRDVDDLSMRATRLLHHVADGRIRLHLSETVVFETVYLLSGFYRVPKQAVGRQLGDLLEMPGIIVENESTLREALHFWGAQGSLSFADCYHLALTKTLGRDKIYSFDKKMDGYPGVIRVEP